MDNLYTILIVVVALGALLLLFKLLKTPLKIAVKLLLNGLMVDRTGFGAVLPRPHSEQVLMVSASSCIISRSSILP